MWDLFKAELLRFRVWAIAFAVIHLFVLGFLTRVVDLAQQPLMIVYRVFGGVYMLAGLLFGLYQMANYRRPNTWLNLLHRPIPRLQIAGALFGAGGTLLLIAIALPILLIAGYQEAMTARVVDLRHWLMPLAALLITWCAYLAGGYAMLGGKRYSWAGLVLLVWIAVADASGPAAMAVQALVLLWLIALIGIVFKPDLSAPPRTAGASIFTALPLQMGLYLGFFLVGLGVTTVWIMLGTHPLNTPEAPHGGPIEAQRAEGKAVLLAGLANSQDPEAPLWREQVGLSEVFQVGLQFSELPSRNELTNLVPMEFDDTERRVRWVFSHDRMRFEGYSLANQRAQGELGVGATHAAFPTPVLPGNDGFLLGADAVYQYDSEHKQIFQRAKLPAGETIVGVPEIIGDNVALASDRALYFYDGRKARDGFELLAPHLRVPLPGRNGNLSRADLIELLDGYLISLTYVEGHYDGDVVPRQYVLRVDGEGHVQNVARRDMPFDFPAYFRYQMWWPSPVMYALANTAERLFAAPVPLKTRTPAPLPRSMLMFAGVLSLLSLLGATWLTRRSTLSPAARWVWVAACGAIGIPALLSLWLLYPEREQADDVPLAQPAAA